MKEPAWRRLVAVTAAAVLAVVKFPSYSVKVRN